MNISNYWILAVAENEASNEVVTMETQTTESVITENGSTNQVQEKPQAKPFGPGNIIFLVAMIGLMYLILFRGPRKQQKEQLKMRQGLQKNDRVQTIGGIYGTVIDIKDDEITLKVDESNNTKIKVAKAAISRKAD